MKYRQVWLSNGVELRLLHTDSTLERLRGLLGHATLPVGDAMVLKGCNLVHTFGMRFAIDIAFVDRQHRIAKICPAVVPGRMHGCLRATRVIELAAGDAARLGWHVGQSLAFLALEEAAV